MPDPDKNKPTAMVLPNVVPKIEDVAEALRPAYVEGEDGSGNKVFLLQTEDNVGLKTALERERGNVTKLSETVDGFKKAGVTVDRFKQIDSEYRALREKSEKGTGDLEAVKTEMAAHYEEQLQTVSSERDGLMGNLKELVVENAAKQAIIDLKGNPHLLTDIVCKQLRMEKDAGGKFTAVVVNEEGQTRLGDMHGNPMTVKQFVEELKKRDEFASAFEGRTVKGPGLNPGDKPGGPGVPADGDPMTRLIAHRRAQG